MARPAKGVAGVAEVTFFPMTHRMLLGSRLRRTMLLTQGTIHRPVTNGQLETSRSVERRFDG